MVHLTTADISDSAGAQAIVAAVRKRWPWLKHLFADGAYDRTRLMDAATYQDFVLENIRRSDKEAGFKVLPRRWVVERTFGWMTRWKRLVRDYEQRIDLSEAMIHVALGSHSQTDAEVSVRHQRLHARLPDDRRQEAGCNVAGVQGTFSAAFYVLRSKRWRFVATYLPSACSWRGLIPGPAIQRLVAPWA